MKKLLSIFIATAMLLSAFAVTAFGETEVMLGDVNGDGIIDIVGDYLEILKHLAGVKSIISSAIESGDQRTLIAADVNKDGVIDMYDAAEILAYIGKVPNIIDGNIDEIIYAEPSIRIEIDTHGKTIQYYTTVAIPSGSRLDLGDYEVIGSEDGVYRFHAATVNDDVGLSGGFIEGQGLKGIVFVGNDVPADTMIVLQRFGGVGTIKVSGTGFQGLTVVNCVEVGCCEPPTIVDALEILKYLAGMKTMYGNANVKPTIEDVLEILKYLAGMKSRFE